MADLVVFPLVSLLSTQYLYTVPDLKAVTTWMCRVFKVVSIGNDIIGVEEARPSGLMELLVGLESLSAGQNFHYHPVSSLGINSSVDV